MTLEQCWRVPAPPHTYTVEDLPTALDTPNFSGLLGPCGCHSPRTLKCLMRKARNDTTRPPAAAAPRVCHLQMRTLGCRAAASEHPRQLEPTPTAGGRDRKLGAFPFGNEQLLIYRCARRVRVFRRCHRDPCTSKNLRKVVLNVANLTQLQERCRVAQGLFVFTSRSCTWRLWPERGSAASAEALGAAWQEEGAPVSCPLAGTSGNTRPRSGARRF